MERSCSQRELRRGCTQMNYLGMMLNKRAIMWEVHDKDREERCEMSCTDLQRWQGEDIWDRIWHDEPWAIDR